MDNKNLSLTLIPAYLIMLSTLNGVEVSKSIKQFLVVLSMSGISITSLQIAIIKLCAKEEMQEHVLTGLWDGNFYYFIDCNIGFITIYYGCILQVWCIKDLV